MDVGVDDRAGIHGGTSLPIRAGRSRGVPLSVVPDLVAVVVENQLRDPRGSLNQP